MAARKQKADADMEAQNKKLEFYAERVEKPLEYLVHDVDAHSSPELQELRDEYGFEAMGRYWLLMELLAVRRGHSYDIDRPHGWQRLAHDMEFGRSESEVEECRVFVYMLADFDLLDSKALDGGKVRCGRIDRTASSAAKAYAERRYATWIREQKRR